MWEEKTKEFFLESLEFGYWIQYESIIMLRCIAACASTNRHSSEYGSDFSAQFHAQFWRKSELREIQLVVESMIHAEYQICSRVMRCCLSSDDTINFAWFVFGIRRLLWRRRQRLICTFHPKLAADGYAILSCACDACLWSGDWWTVIVGKWKWNTPMIAHVTMSAFSHCVIRSWNANN